MDKASFYMMRLLNVACKSEREKTVVRLVLDGMCVGRLTTVFDCEDRFLKDESWQNNPKVEQHPLASYQQILEGAKSVSEQHLLPLLLKSLRFSNLITQ